MASIVDAGAVLMPAATYNANQSFSVLQLYPRQLPTAVVIISLQSPPTGTATFAIEVASTSGGVYREIARLVWPAGLTGARDVPLGVSARGAWLQNTTSAWLRLSLTTTGALTGSAWLMKPTDGGIGTGADVGDVLTGTAA
jgi:hypothetical protein